MANVVFAKGLQAAYDDLEVKNENTIYFITDTPAIYIGSTKYTSATELAKAVERIGVNEKDITSLKSALAGIDLAKEGSVKALIDAVSTKVGSLEGLKTTAKTDIIAAINEIHDTAAAAGKSVSVSTDTTTAGFLKSYEILQGGEHVATIDIPKDLVVTAGETVEATADAPITIGATQYTSGEFLKLTIANQDAPVYINATKLVDVYTAAQNATQIQLAVDKGVISAKVVAGSIGTADLADTAITTAKIADANVTKAKLSTEVQATLDKADSAVQTIKSGATNGTIAVDGTDIAVTGLASAAYAETSAFDAAGTAAQAKTDLIGTTADPATANTINGAKAAASAAQKAAEAANSAATAAETNAKTYTDNALQWNSLG